MEKLFETALFTRTSMLNILENKSFEELVTIPVHFRNSVFWNIAHVLVTQQLLCYRLSGLDLKIREDMVTKYGKGSLATENIDESDIRYVKEELVNAMKNTFVDYNNGMFKHFKPYMTSAGIELKSIDDAFGFSTFHDGIHLGVVLSLMKIV
ncbi:DinB family protein [Lutimonas vermicola]|uniref:DinB family protein n=1 Tax=Lutimonas vermicola TaxID=414288 RepID=A0ABU9L361_9FLAO